MYIINCDDHEVIENVDLLYVKPLWHAKISNYRWFRVTYGKTSGYISCQVGDIVIMQSDNES